MFVLSPFVYIPALVMLIGIFFNTRSLYRRSMKTRFADKASAVATVFTVVSLSVPMLLFVGLPGSVKLLVWAVCAFNFGRAVWQIVRAVQWFGRARQADQANQNTGKKYRVLSQVWQGAGSQRPGSRKNSEKTWLRPARKDKFNVASTRERVVALRNRIRTRLHHGVFGNEQQQI